MIAKNCGNEDAALSEDSEEDPYNLQDDDGWDDAEPDEEHAQFISLLDNEIFSDIFVMLRHCKDKHQFDFLNIRQKLGLDFYGTIKLVNYVRDSVRHSNPVPVDITMRDLDDEKYLKPVLEDDAVLFTLDELPAVGTAPKEESREQSNEELLARVSTLEEGLKGLQTHFENYRETVKETLEQRWNIRSGKGETEVTEEKRDDDSHYFTSYSYNDIHSTMLKDTIRTNAYRDFIYDNKYLFAGKVVLDVGCGTGILSMFCARAGASLVIAVDNSSIIDRARSIVFANSLSPPIVLLKGKIEEVKLPVSKVDIIISEWMGYALLYEAMLDSVIWARDKYLNHGGIMAPSHMNLWMAPVEDQEYIGEHVTWWRDVYGFDMGAMQEGICDDALVLQMLECTLCADPISFLHLNLYEITVEELSLRREWKLVLNRDVDSLDGFAVWFDTFFTLERVVEESITSKATEWTGKGVAFTTGPSGKSTHWKQTLLLVDNTKKKPTSRKAGEEVSGFIEYSVPGNNSRALNIKMAWKFGTDGQEVRENKQVWTMK